MSAREQLTSADERREEIRAANERIAAAARRLRFVARVPMLCECGDEDCTQIVMLGLPEYGAARRDPRALVTAPGHA